MSEKLEDLISLLYQDKLTQYGKRLLVENIEKLQKENEELKADNYELNNRITDLLENIPVQKIKDLMGEKEWAIKSYDCSEADYNQSQAVGAWFACQRLLEERKK